MNDKCNKVTENVAYAIFVYKLFFIVFRELMKAPQFHHSWDQLFRKKEIFRRSPVGKRVFYLAIQSIINAILIGFLAKLLISLIALITLKQLRYDL